MVGFKLLNLEKYRNKWIIHIKPLHKYTSTSTCGPGIITAQKIIMYELFYVELEKLEEMIEVDIVYHTS